MGEAHKLKGSTEFKHQYDKYPIGDFLIISNENLSLIFFIEDENVKESVYKSIESNPDILKGLDQRSREYLEILNQLIKMDMYEIVDVLLGI